MIVIIYFLKYYIGAVIAANTKEGVLYWRQKMLR